LDGLQLLRVLWGRSSLPRRKRERVLAACKSRRMQVVMQNVRQTRWEVEKHSMAIIKAPPKQPKSVTVQARVEESVKMQLDQYAKLIDSTPSYVITEALKVLFKRDNEFKIWLGQQTINQNRQRIQVEVLTKTA
jgi:predicted transcriptional regulator